MIVKRCTTLFATYLKKLGRVTRAPVTVKRNCSKFNHSEKIKERIVCVKVWATA